MNLETNDPHEDSCCHSDGINTDGRDYIGLAVSLGGLAICIPVIAYAVISGKSHFLENWAQWDAVDRLLSVTMSGILFASPAVYMKSKNNAVFVAQAICMASCVGLGLLVLFVLPHFQSRAETCGRVYHDECRNCNPSNVMPGRIETFDGRVVKGITVPADHASGDFACLHKLIGRNNYEY